MFVNDVIDIFFINIGVPDIIGIDDNGWSQITTTETAGHVCPHASFAMDTLFLGAFLHLIPHVLWVEVTTTRLTGRALIGAKENMITIK